MISPHVGGKVLPTGKSFSTLLTAGQTVDMNNESLDAKQTLRKKRSLVHCADAMVTSRILSRRGQKMRANKLKERLSFKLNKKRIHEKVARDFPFTYLTTEH